MGKPALVDNLVVHSYDLLGIKEKLMLESEAFEGYEIVSI